MEKTGFYKTPVLFYHTLQHHIAVLFYHTAQHHIADPLRFSRYYIQITAGGLFFASAYSVAIVERSSREETPALYRKMFSV
jgi:hypothetical protein